MATQEEFDKILAHLGHNWKEEKPPTRMGQILAKIKVRNTIRSILQIKQNVGLWRMLTFPLRRNLPDFFIIGAAKSGTTTLFNMVASHPDVCDASAVKRKEPQYFGAQSFPLRWYRCLFPIKKGRSLICDASITSLPSSIAPVQVSYVLPNAKFIVILRDPVDRVLSHYEFNRRRGLEGHPPPPALKPPWKLSVRAWQKAYNSTYHIFLNI